MEPLPPPLPPAHPVPRLWGAWKSVAFQSGTLVVCLVSLAGKPHLYVYADMQDDEDAQTLACFGMTGDLTAFLNGEPRPSWLDDFQRTTATRALTGKGGMIEASGPMVDLAATGAWVSDRRPPAAAARAQLMDMLFPDAR